jgi:hypothetical protein
MRDESGLDGVKRVLLRQALNREDIRTIMAKGKRKTRIDSSALHKDRAGAALPAIATFLGSCKVEAFAQEIQQGHSRILQSDGPQDAIDGERN